MTEIDPFERLKSLETRTYNKRYFYYEASTGNVVSIHNHVVDDHYPFVEVSVEELPENFLSLNLKDFIVIKENDKRKVIVKKHGISRIDGSIPTVYVTAQNDILDNVDLLIRQKNSTKEFVLSLSENAKEHYRRNGSSLNFIFFVTLENDPSILYTSFMIPFSDLLDKESVSVPFGVYDGSRSNLYTIKFFSTYLHAVYNENKDA